MTTTQTRPNVNYGNADVALGGEILRTVVGSGVHGIAIPGTDDHDEMGVFIEPAEMVAGIKAWSYVHNRPIYTEGEGMPNYVWRTQPEGARSGPGDTDLVLYSLRKFLRLAAKGNPTVLIPLWASGGDVLVTSEAGEELRGLRDAFMSQHAVHRFLAYMEAQHERMMGRGKQNRVPNRPELVQAHGYDTKYAAHALRLSIQGHEVAAEGTLTLPLPDHARDLVLSVKRGEHPREEVSGWIEERRAATRRLLDTGGCHLPADADWSRINAFAVSAHLTHWSR